MRHRRKYIRREMRVVLAAVLVGLMTAVIMVLVMMAEAGKHVR